MPVPGETFFVETISNIDKTYKQLNNEFIRVNSGGYKDIVSALSSGATGIVLTIIGVFYTGAICAISRIVLAAATIASEVKKELQKCKLFLAYV
ncbi:hypothetical protein [Gottfriedia solisilvae]|uniref:hypothetical protein n=1 Tax=Gottfriedia solisilvae TaxID=1516104 RepID=UPI003D2EC0C6